MTPYGIIGGVPNALEYRPAGSGDTEAIGETTRQGFEGYRAFMPRGWAPPPAELETGRVAERLGEAHSWLFVALDAGRPAGHAGFTLARTRDEARTLVPGLAHLFHLFVREPWWGTGVADELHRRALEEAARRGFPAIRLYTPAGQARARAFYERRGWRVQGEPVHEPMLAMELVEYRRTLAVRL
jgi:GNAT superfamily N-acetyltransferase